MTVSHAITLCAGGPTPQKNPGRCGPVGQCNTKSILFNLNLHLTCPTRQATSHPQTRLNRPNHPSPSTSHTPRVADAWLHAPLAPTNRTFLAHAGSPPPPPPPLNPNPNPPPPPLILSNPIQPSMAAQAKLLYIVVVDGNGDAASFRYTRSVLHSTLQLMGCKPRHAFKISRRVFDVMRGEQVEMGLQSQEVAEMTSPRQFQFELYKRQTTVVVTRDRFLDVVSEALSLYKYVGPNQRADFRLACRIREKKESVTILLCGTSGCGKSTLSTLLGSRLGTTTVVSTDSIRHMMRSFVDEKENPLLWASTYHAGECLDPVAVAQEKARRKAKKRSGMSSSSSISDEKGGVLNDKADSRSPDLAPGFKPIGKKQMAIEGYKAQSEMVIDSLDRLITAWEDRKESVVVEGVHLSLNFVMGLMRKHPSIIPFMVYISNEGKHTERFAVRAKYMTLDPAKNKYVKYISNIRAIQEYLCNRADKYLVPKINNTNVDRSVAAIHATNFSCLRRRAAGDQLYDPITNTVAVVDEEYRNQCVANSMSSKGMFKLIQRLGSSRKLMAILNIDGSVSKAWPVESGGDGKPSSGNGGEKSVGDPIYGPLHIGRAESVNLQFGPFGISAWPTDQGCTSHAGGVDDSWADATEGGSRHVPSLSSSPKMSDGPAKEIKESSAASGSEEEADVPADAESDEDLSDVENREIHEEMEGSVDEDSNRSDEEYDDLAMRDGIENGYLTDDDMVQTSLSKSSDKKFSDDNQGNHVTARKYQENLDTFLKTNADVPENAGSSAQPANTSSKRNSGKKWKRSLSDSQWTQNRSVPSLGKSESMYRGSAVSVAPQR